MALEFDFAPLWLPDDERTAQEQASAQPADRVDGWNWGNLFLTAIIGSRSKTLSRAGAVAALALFVITAPTLARGNTLGLARVAFLQILVTALLLALTRRTRSVSAGTVVVHWLAGVFLAPFALTLVDGAISLVPGTDGVVLDWLRPVLALVLPASILAVAVVREGRQWAHPGVADLTLLGYAVGAGLTFHQDGLFDSTLGTEFVGHAALWIALLGFAVGLALLERSEITLLTAAVTGIAVLGDALILDLRWLPAVLLVGAFGAAVSLDRRRLDDVEHRDHLFPDAADRHHNLLVGRYRRLRNGVHTTIALAGEQWPPREGGPVAELARAGRAAAVSVGRDTSRFGWDRNPDDRTGASRRFFGPNGWTPFLVSENGPTVGAPRSRPEAAPRSPSSQVEPEWRSDRRLLVIGGAIAGLVALAVLTTSFDGIGQATLTAAPSSPPLVRTALGAAAAGAAVFGRARPELGEAWELGPPDHHEA